MRECCHPGLMILAIGGMLLAGCASSPRSHAPEAASPKPKFPVPAVGADSGDIDQKLVEAHAHYTLGTMYDVDEQPDLALEEYSKAALDDPANEELVLELSGRYLHRKDPEKALAVLLRATEVPNASGEVFAELGLVQSRLGKDREALEASTTAVKRAPLSLSGYRNLFLIYLQKGQTAPALAALDQAAKQPGTSGEFLIALAEFYATLERQAPSMRDVARAGAKAVLERAADLDLAGPQLRLRLADGLNLAGDSTNAARIYIQLLNRYIDVPALREEVRAKLADIYVRSNDAEKAKEQLQAIIRDDPANATAYYFLGELAYDAKNLPEAEDYFRKSLLLFEDFPKVYYELAEVQINLDHAKAALKTLEQAHKKFKDNFTSEFLTGLAYNRDKDYTNAVNHYVAAEVQARASSEQSLLTKYFYFQEGAAYERKGDFEQAERCFDKAIELEPEYPEALNYLGYMLADRGVKLERARAMIEKAVKLEPKNAAYLDSLGWVLYKLNQPQEALPPELKAVECSPEPDATLYDHLGDIYAALKQPDKAQDAWRKSLSVEPNEEIRKKLEPAATESTSTGKPDGSR
jgi:tetratricopeptide (TPR) repeat protein